MAYNGRKYRLVLTDGLDKNKNQAQRRPSALEVADNVSIHENNIQRDFGETKINSTAIVSAPIVRTGFDYWSSVGIQDTVVYLDRGGSSNGELRQASGIGSGSYGAGVTGLHGTKVGQFVQAGHEATGGTRKLFFFNGFDFPYVIIGPPQTFPDTYERIGHRAQLTDKLDTTSGSTTMAVNDTGHGLVTGVTVSLVGFTNPIDGQDPNVTNALVTVVNKDKFTVEVAGNFTGTTASTGGTGDYYAHPADWSGTTQPSGAVMHNNRLIAWLNHTLYVSNATNHGDFEVDDFSDLQIFTDLGEEIRACASFYGRVIVFKYPYGIVQVINPEPFGRTQISKLHDRIGIAGKNSFVQANKDLWFLSSEASLHSLLAVKETGDVHDSSISNAFYLDPFIRDKIDMSKLDKSDMVYDSINRMILIALTKSGSSENDLLLKVDINNPRNPRFVLTEKGSYVSLWSQVHTNRQIRPVGGTKSGFIRELNDSDRSVDGAAYTSTFRTSLTDMSDQFPEFKDVNKRLDFIEAILEPDGGDSDITFKIYVDGVVRDQVTFILDSDNPTFPVTFPITFSEEFVQNRRSPVEGCYGKRFAIEGSTNAINKNFKISDLILYVRAGDNRIMSEATPAGAI